MWFLAAPATIRYPLIPKASALFDAGAPAPTVADVPIMGSSRGASTDRF